MMETFRNNLEKGSRQKIVLTIVGLVVVVGIIVGVIILLQNHLGDDSNVLIDNYGETDIPMGYRDVIQKELSEILKKNDAIAAVDLVDAEIREGSYKESKTDDATIAEFIIDIVSLRYSFQVGVVWWNGIGNGVSSDPDVEIKCPYYTDVIYKDTKCIAQEPYQQIKKYLPYYQYLENRKKIGVSLQQYNTEYYLAVEIKACGDTALMDAAVNATRKWIKSIYLDPNDYYLVPSDICRS